MNRLNACCDLLTKDEYAGRAGKLGVIVLLLIISLVSSLPIPAAGQAPPLMGEGMHSLLDIPSITSPDRCPTGPVSFTVSGIAVGPYPGTFTESITIAGNTFEASFAIDSAIDVAGTKSGTVSFECFTFFTSSAQVLSIGFEGTAMYNADVPDQGIAQVGGNFFIVTDLMGTVQNRGGAFSQRFVLSTLGPPFALLLQPVADTNEVGTRHTVTARVVDALGRPIPGVEVDFIVEGSVNTAGSCTTNSTGQCEFSYTGPQFPGADLITAFVDSDRDNTFDPGEPISEATKAWVLPSSTPGQVTGGGQINKALILESVAFGFNARSTLTSFQGHCNVVDREAGIHIKCLDVEALVVVGTHATIFGRATVNGTQTRYRILVDDLDEPGRFRDTFSIITENGYAATGLVTQGNIQIHGSLR